MFSRQSQSENGAENNDIPVELQEQGRKNGFTEA